jgi:nitrite reductase (NADH) small subunit
MATWTDVGPADDFHERQMRLVEHDQREIVVLRVGEEVFAMRNTCPHAAAKICLGRIVPRIEADRPGPGEGKLVDAPPVVTCPWHGWEFDPRDGRAIADPRMRLKIWPAKIEDDRLLVEL